MFKKYNRPLLITFYQHTCFLKVHMCNPPMTFLFYFIGLSVCNESNFGMNMKPTYRRIWQEASSTCFSFRLDPHVGRLTLTILFWLHTSLQYSLLHESGAFLMENSILSSPLELEYFTLWKEGKKRNMWTESRKDGRR